MELAATNLQEKKPTVLIADDDTPTRILLRAAISQWGYSIIEAKDGEEAWNILQKPNAPRLLILDWLMPKIDGITLCSRSRQELAYHPYIILLSQVTGTINIIKGLEAGADEFLSKPFNMVELRSRLSIGARIINDENKLAEQYQQLQGYINQMGGLASYSLEISKQIHAAKHADPFFAKQISELYKSLENMVAVIQKIQSESKRKN